MKKTILLLIAFIILSACGQDFNSDVRTGRKSKTQSQSGSVKILTEAERKIFATTTMYYVETFFEKDVNDCELEKKINMIDRKGQLLVRVCEKVRKSCLLQGTCIVSIRNKMSMLNVDGHFQGVRSFRDITGNECKYGRGASSDGKKSYKNMCIDPFYSVAADLKIYNLGDVIYLPIARGLALPNGETHDGYFVIRDTGGGLKGEGRFDFFSGFYSPKNSANSLAKIKLNDRQSFPEYFMVTGSELDRVLKDRNFPFLPRTNEAKINL